MYLFSLKAVKEVFHKAIDRCPATDNVADRVKLLVENITLSVFRYILRLQNQIPGDASEFLLHQTLEDSTLESPVEYMSANAWAAIRLEDNGEYHLNAKSLLRPFVAFQFCFVCFILLDEFQGLDRDLEATPKRWRKFLDSEFPEKEALPQEWKNRATAFHKLCIVRCLRPDRIVYAIRDFVADVLGPAFVNSRSNDLDDILGECSSKTPILFILSPGVDPLHDLEACGERKGFNTAGGNFQNVSLGQGQESIAEQTMDTGASNGHWVVLQNIHLAKGWLHRLEKKLEELGNNEVHENFRLFLSANPPEEGGGTENKIIPPGVLESCLKVTNEPPKGMLANLHKALDNFSQETFDSSAREGEFKSLLFTLCYFHAVLTERKKFGSQGWNFPYPFNDSDLLISANVLHNHLDSEGGRSAIIPWDDLRFLFGEIMYGGHITDDKDRKVCSSYLNRFFNSEQLEADYPLCPGFGMPAVLDYEGYHQYVDENLPGESPSMYGLHSNAEIGCLTDASNSLLRALHLLEPSIVDSNESPLFNPVEVSRFCSSQRRKGDLSQFVSYTLTCWSFDTGNV
ncbi:dynein heavy chain 9, axonemal [Caerostris extrusa]|uniref:Dynein heavy chain 9, axonemal n=1 Tax=Caerostris extrusa TaxID=172846 RepID=A0AAV4V6B4_CAEEX|nr:dynein heavy chain 9, axonemal [Caerostris extrusa]